MDIKLIDLMKAYQTSTDTIQVLKGIDLEIPSGSWMTITGPSGSGKTSLLRCLSGIERPDQGQMFVGTEDVMNYSEDEVRTLRRSSMGYIFQDFQLFSQFDVKTNVSIPLLPYESSSSVNQKALSVLEKVGLSHRIKHMPSQLSGGEKQRVAIARALINESKIILCDEPTGNLDMENRDRIMSLLKEIHSEGVTIILVTHDPELANYGDYFYEMRNGTLLSKIKN